MINKYQQRKAEIRKKRKRREKIKKLRKKYFLAKEPKEKEKIIEKMLKINPNLTREKILKTLKE